MEVSRTNTELFAFSAVEPHSSDRIYETRVGNFIPEGTRENCAPRNRAKNV
jgi:hypothetical protein